MASLGLKDRNQSPFDRVCALRQTTSSSYLLVVVAERSERRQKLGGLEQVAVVDPQVHHIFGQELEEDGRVFLDYLRVFLKIKTTVWSGNLTTGHWSSRGQAKAAPVLPELPALCGSFPPAGSE